VTDQSSTEGRDPRWGPPKRRLKKEFNKRLKAEAGADKFLVGEVIMPKKEARKAGIAMRPLDDGLKAEIVQRLAAGELMRSILKEPEMPSLWTVYVAMEKDAQFAADIAMARKIAADGMADEIIEISDHAAEDYKADGSINYEAIARSKLKTDNRKWLIERMDPSRWGSKGQIDVTSGGEKLETRELNPLESARQVAFALELAKRSQEPSE
jgi:hypothetical protein